MLEKVSEYLSAELNRTVEITSYDETSNLQADLESQAVDILIMNSYGYVFAHAKYPDYNAFAALGKNNTLDSYKSCIITQPGSKIKNITQLKDNAAEVDMRFVHPTSTSGHIVPRYELRKEGLTQAEMDFKSLELTGSQEKAIMEVVNGEATAAACGKSTLAYLQEQGKINADQYQIIWTSHDIQGAPIVFNEKLPDELKNQIKEAFLNMEDKAPELMQFIRDSFHSEGSNFIAVNDSNYDLIRNMASSMDDLILFLNFYLQ
ncbi:MAG: phosphate/phosphite/phosphonate ABC transporter substrate-binding protein [Salinivirgaceae bacterium]